jgi:hypothetical protein
MAIRSIGLKQGRKLLSHLAGLANGGQGILLTKYGKPYAAIVEPEVLLRTRRKKSSFLALRGTGKGLWGRSASKGIAAARGGWN